MLRKEIFSRDDLEWANDVSFKIRFVAGITLPLCALVLKLMFQIPFPMLALFLVSLFEAFINQPYSFIRRRMKSLYKLIVINTSIDVIMITLFNHYAGGIEAPFFVMLYLLPIIFATTNISALIGIWLATLSTVAYSALLGLEYFHVIEHVTTTGLQMTGKQQLISCMGATFFFYVLCYFADLPSSQLRKKSRKLRETLSTVQQRAEQLASASHICRDIASSLSIDAVLGKVVEEIAKTFKADRISILLIDEEGRLTIKASMGISQKIASSTSINVGEDISGWVTMCRKPILVENIDEHSHFAARSKERYYTKSLMSCPLVVKNNVIGVININNSKESSAFSLYELELIETLCADIAVSIENARLYTELRQSYINTVESLAVAVDARDHYTQGHLNRVCGLALAIGKQMNLSRKRLENLRIAAILHDIGKIGISDNILLKSGKLSDTEWIKMKEHPLVSERIVIPLGFPKQVSEIIRHHHERYDGKGYPDGESGKKLSLEAHILVSADAYDAMVTQRPYKKILDEEKAKEQLRLNSGSQFHPRVVDAFLSILEKKKLK